MPEYLTKGQTIGIQGLRKGVRNWDIDFVSVTHGPRDTTHAPSLILTGVREQRSPTSVTLLYQIIIMQLLHIRPSHLLNNSQNTD